MLKICFSMLTFAKVHFANKNNWNLNEIRQTFALWRSNFSLNYHKNAWVHVEMRFVPWNFISRFTQIFALPWQLLGLFKNRRCATSTIGEVAMLVWSIRELSWHNIILTAHCSINHKFVIFLDSSVAHQFKTSTKWYEFNLISRTEFDLKFIFLWSNFFFSLHFACIEYVLSNFPSSFISGSPRPHELKTQSIFCLKCWNKKVLNAHRWQCVSSLVFSI